MALLLLTGCQVDTYVDIDVSDDGGGTVTVSVALDRAAAQRTIGFEEELPIGDLEATGWAVTEPVLEPDGRTWVQASKPFATADQLDVILTEVSGETGPFSDFGLEQVSEFAETTWTLNGTVDLTEGLADFSDPELTELLGGLPFGRSRESLEAALGAPMESFVSMTVGVNLPGDLQTTNAARSPLEGEEESEDPIVVDGTTTTVAGDAPLAIDPIREPAELEWYPDFADPAPSSIEAVAQTSRLAPRLWRWLGLGALVAAALALIYRLSQLLMDKMAEARERRRRRSRPDPVPSAPRPVGPMAQTVPSGPDDALRAVVLDAVGTIVRVDDVFEEIVLPFAREQGSTLTRDSVLDQYVARTLGATSSASFWSALGIHRDPQVLDDAFIRRLPLGDGITDFLFQARAKSLLVGAVANDAADWSARFRQLHELDPMINPWVTSAEVGTRLPNPAMLDTVQRALGVPPQATLLIGSRADVLDLARERGYRTVRYADNGTVAPGSTHPVLRSFTSSV